MKPIPKPNSKYYESPEGQDAFAKMMTTNKYAVAFGLAWSTVDVLMVSKPKGYIPTIGRFIYFTVPLAGMASAFTLGTFFSTRLRNKDDKLNYAIGALSAGGVYGAWRKSVVAGFVGAGILTIAAVLKKMSIEDGWEFFPNNRYHQFGTLHETKHDFTMMETREKNWTSGSQ